MKHLSSKSLNSLRHMNKRFNWSSLKKEKMLNTVITARGKNVKKQKVIHFATKNILEQLLLKIQMNLMETVHI